MVLRFKLRAEDRISFEVTEDEVQARIARNAPWFVSDRESKQERYYAVCPWCDNPIRLKGLYRNNAGKRPYGSHTGTSRPDVGRFDLSRQLACPYRLTRQPSKDDRREPSEADAALIAFVRDEFDRIVLTLREDLGVHFSNTTAARMLQSWYDNSGYLYRHVNYRNLPWMIPYMAQSIQLYGQKGFSDEMKSSIETKVASVCFTDAGQLQSTEPWLSLTLQSLHHRIDRNADETITESMKLWVKDYTKTNDPSSAPLIYETVVTFDHDRFERLVATPAARAHRNHSLLEVAYRILGDR